MLILFAGRVAVLAAAALPMTGFNDTGSEDADARSTGGAVVVEVEVSGTGASSESGEGWEPSSGSVNAGEPFDFEAWYASLPRARLGGGVEKVLMPPPRGGGAPESEGAAPAQPTLPSTLTSSAVQSFAPGATGFTMEPHGWAIVGSNTNAYASATNHTTQASILNIPIEVTFEPVEYRWDWGDGSTLTSEAGGSSWGTQGLANWSQTSTSHVYRERGEVNARLTVAYRATVRAQGRTIPVTGLVTGQAQSQSVLVVESERALVVENCLENRRAPGC